MTLEEIRQARREAEARIRDELTQLEARTGMKYHSISVGTTHGGTSFVVGSHDEVRRWDRVDSVTIELKLA